MANSIVITPPGGSPVTIELFNSLSVTLSATSRSGSFRFNILGTDTSIFDVYTVGSDVKITMGDNVFRGFVLNAKKSLSNQLKILAVDGVTYTGRTQKIIISESYTNEKISDIVIDLFTKYAPGYNTDSVVACDRVTSIKFNHAFLFEAMEDLATLAGYDWFIDEPVPEIIPSSQPAGWAELATVAVNQVIFPSETLYPSEALIPY